MKVYYKEEKKMDPRDGNKFSTIYYKQDSSEKQKLDGHIQKVWRECTHATDESIKHWLDKPMKEHRHRRKNGTYYTRMDAVVDAHRHSVIKGHDMTDSIMTRFNHAFEDQPNTQIVMEKGVRPPNNIDDLIQENE
jgi:hypothetical protein